VPLDFLERAARRGGVPEAPDQIDGVIAVVALTQQHQDFAGFARIEIDPHLERRARIEPCAKGARQ
jgi:hypothetical protein